MPTLAELAALVGGRVDGPEDVEIDGIAPLDQAGERHLSFLTDDRYLKQMEGTHAGAVLVGPGRNAFGHPALVVNNPLIALGILVQRFAPVPPPVTKSKIDSSAWVHSTAKLAEGVEVGPYAVIGPEVEIGEGTTVAALCSIGWQSKIGKKCRLYPFVVVGDRTRIDDEVIIHSGTVLGADGFGFVPGPQGPKKVPQIGCVVLESNVEVGANCTIDRATVGETILRKGVKLDDQVHIAHNCVIGEGTLIAGQTGISGSTTVGKGCLFGGQVGVADHLRIGHNVKIGAKSGIHRDVPDGTEMFGYPARPAREALKLAAEVGRLPRLVERIRALDARLKEIERKLGGGDA